MEPRDEHPERTITWSYQGREYLVTLRFRLLPRVEIEDVRVTTPPGADYPVTRIALRAIPLGELEDQLRPSRQEVVSEGASRLDVFLASPLFSHEEREQLRAEALGLYEEAAMKVPPKRRGGRAPKTLDDLLPVAAAYVRAWEAGRHDLWQAVQEKFPHDSKWTVLRWVKQAKEMGLIPSGVGPYRGGKDKR